MAASYYYFKDSWTRFDVDNMIEEGDWIVYEYFLLFVLQQAAVLLLFNDENKLSYAEIEERLNLEDDDLLRLLHAPNTRY